MKFVVFAAVAVACLMVVRSEDSDGKKDKICEPNSEYKKDCNNCKCNDDGTKEECESNNCSEHSTTEKDKLDDEDEKCTPGQTFKNKCNDCTCPPTGRKAGAACTLLNCPSN